MIYLTADHGGYELKQKIAEYLKSEKHEFIDLGTQESDANDDYPERRKRGVWKARSAPVTTIMLMFCV